MIFENKELMANFQGRVLKWLSEFANQREAFGSNSVDGEHLSHILLKIAFLRANRH